MQTKPVDHLYCVRIDGRQGNRKTHFDRKRLFRFERLKYILLFTTTKLIKIYIFMPIYNNYHQHRMCALRFRLPFAGEKVKSEIVSKYAKRTRCSSKIN